MKFNRTSCLLFLAVASVACSPTEQSRIDRDALLARNYPVVSGLDTLASLTVGNGHFAMTTDFTGLQTFPTVYSAGVPLGTQSDWGWHSFPNPDSLLFEETLRDDDMGHGHNEVYSRQIKDNVRGKAASDWYRINPHRLHLGTLGFDVEQGPDEFSNINCRLNLKSGKITSSFTLNEAQHLVNTVCHPTLDLIATRVSDKAKTPLCLTFPYPTGKHSDDGCNWTAQDLHSVSIEKQTENSIVVRHTLDSTTYFATLQWNGSAKAEQTAADRITLFPDDENIEVSLLFSPALTTESLPTYEQVEVASDVAWQEFWRTGAAVDFSSCTDPRAAELERRVVLSQYLLAAQCAGNVPPQESGLTYNTWFGKFHLEMIYWHQAWLPLWGHADKLQHTLAWYHVAEPNARAIAERQGFKGIRWMKMTDPSSLEAPSNVGSYLIWQQPHLIHLAELAYRTSADKAFLNDMAPLVEKTAEFMADFVTWNAEKNRFDLRGFIPAQETLHAKDVVNAPFELSYWHFGLNIAQLWRERMGKPRNEEWDKIINNLAPLAFNADSLYLAAETAVDTYSDIRFTSDHPAVLGALGILPLTYQVNTEVMKKTLAWVCDNWNWNKTWGWDYPMVAMCATRLGLPDVALSSILMNNRTNTYLPNGHNYQDERLRCYLPGNGGLLTTIALMCAGWDGCDVANPGFPKDGKWNVRWEGLKPLP